MKKIPASQLLYTNVEAEQSPKGRRGFQIWLASKSLAEPQQLEIARRLDDFQLPEANANDQELARHVFFQLADGHFVIAQSKPLLVKDRFGRGGRFFAHALIVSEKDFERIDYDPFRLLNGSALFYSSPDEVLKTDIDWRSGELPPASISVTDEPELGSPSPMTEAIFAELVGWLPLQEERTIAIPERPESVREIVRDLFRFLPPHLRKVCSFDTLSTGEHLSKLPYRIAGSYSPAMLRCWIFRKSHRLDREPPKFHPSLAQMPESLATMLAVRWLTHPISDDQKIAALHLVAALEETRLSDCDPLLLKEEVLSDLVSIPQVHDLTKRAIESRLREDLGEVLAGLSQLGNRGMEYLEFGTRDGYHRLTQPIPVELLGEWLLELFETMIPPPLEELAALRAWVHIRQASVSTRLKMLVARWTPSQIPRLIKILQDSESSTLNWFREWCLKSLSRTWQTRDGLNRIARTIADKGLDPILGSELNLFLALHAHDENANVLWLKFWLGVAERNTVLMEHLIDTETTILERLFGDWLPDLTLVPRWVCHRPVNSLQLFFGFDLLPEYGTGSRVLPILRILADGVRRKRFYDHWFPFATPPEEVCRPVVEVADSPQLPRAREKFERYMIEEQWPKIPELLKKVDDKTFAALTNIFLVPKVMPTLEKLYISDDCFWVGLKLMLMDRENQREFHVVEAFFQALMPIHDLDAQNQPERPFADVEHRLRWLMARLRQPPRTEKLPLNRDGW